MFRSCDCHGNAIHLVRICGFPNFFFVSCLSSSLFAYSRTILQASDTMLVSRLHAVCLCEKGISRHLCITIKHFTRPDTFVCLLSGKKLSVTVSFTSVPLLHACCKWLRWSIGGCCRGDRELDEWLAALCAFFRFETTMVCFSYDVGSNSYKVGYTGWNDNNTWYSAHNNSKPMVSF